MGRDLLIIGGGFIGSAVARSAATGVGYRRVVVLGHSTPVEDVEGAHVVYGDARAPDLGLDPPLADDLRTSVADIVIAVGRVQFGLSLAAATSDAIAPVNNSLAFAESCSSLRTVVLVSSMFAAGPAEGIVRSDWIPPRGHHRNFYEWAKQETERAVRASSLPNVIIRPGHVLNAVDGSGCTPTPTGIFEALPALAAGWPIPCDPVSRYWITPVDVLARMVLGACHQRPLRGATWCVHPRSPTLGQVLDMLAMRHGLGAKRIRSKRFGPRAASLLRPAWLGLDLPRELLSYLHADLRLDLSCQQALGDAMDLDIDTDLTFVAETVDHEVRRARTLR